MTRLTIRRGSDPTVPRWEQFEVDLPAGASVLDALMQIRATTDATLAVRYSCISANVCKECVMVIDGTKEYACMARLSPDAMTLEPLPGKGLIRDLVTELVPPKEQL